MRVEGVLHGRLTYARQERSTGPNQDALAGLPLRLETAAQELTRHGIVSLRSGERRNEALKDAALVCVLSWADRVEDGVRRRLLTEARTGLNGT